MSRREIDRLLEEVPALEGMRRDHLELIAGCGSIRSFEAGDRLFREGEAADYFYALRRGRVALEIFVTGRGPITIETLGPGELLGWSWIFPPFRWHLDATARERGTAIAFDAACLRGKCDEDHELGYELMRRFATLLIERLQATRIQLLDVYGHAEGE
ncbi:MAG: cyclic nucleotide-binding domain-containing protein [Solirubrobacterales bacterium]